MAQEKILIVDDDEDLHTLYGLYLQGESYQILHAYHGAEALEKAKQDKPDVIILDMIMPVMDGEEFFVKIQGDDVLKNVPVIIASVNEKIPKKLQDFKNFYSALKKPFTIQTLVSKIKAALAKE